MTRSHSDRLPRDGWRREPVCRKLSHLFDRHMLPLLVDVNLSGSLQTFLYSGFLYEHQGMPFWITAAHVCKEIAKILGTPSARITTLKWVDSSSDGGVPIAREHLTLLPFESAGIDVGIGVLRPYYANLILHRGEKVCLDSRGGIPEPTYTPEGYYLVGFPGEKNQIVRRQVDSDHFRADFNSPLYCVPVERVVREGQSGDLWDYPDAFYGQLLPFANGQLPDLASIKFMSGGPIVSLEIKNRDAMIYRLEAVQSAWEPK